MINVWLLVRSDFIGLCRKQLSGFDKAARQRFKKSNVSGYDWHLESLYVDSYSDIETLLSSYRGNGRFVQAWDCETGEPVTDRKGKRKFRMQLHRLVEYMPDIVSYDVNGNESAREIATNLSQVALMQGQAPRIFK